MRQLLVNLRNTKVENAVKKKYVNMGPDRNSLQIFKVSSTDYEKHLRGYDEEDIPLPLGETGVVGLRKLMLTLPAQGRLDALHVHWRGNLTSVVDSLWTWSSQSATHYRREIRQILERPREVWTFHFYFIVRCHCGLTRQQRE